MAKNKIIFGDKVLIDLTTDTITVDALKKGVTAHDKSGEKITGTNTFDSDTSEDTAEAAETLEGKTFHARGALIVGKMPNKGEVSGEISDADDIYSIPYGFHDGAGKVKISDIEVAKLKNHANIKAGITILGETGTYSGEAVSAQSKTATPTETAQTILPDSGFDYLSQVDIEPIPYEEIPNSAGGITIKIG